MKFEQWKYFYRARFFLLLKQDARAINAFKLALGINPGFGLAASCLGHLYASQGQMNLAETTFLEALRINPNDAVTHFNLGFNYDRQKQHVKAIAAFKSAVRLNPRYFSFVTRYSSIK